MDLTKAYSYNESLISALTFLTKEERVEWIREVYNTYHPTYLLYAVDNKGKKICRMHVDIQGANVYILDMGTPGLVDGSWHSCWLRESPNCVVDVNSINNLWEAITERFNEAEKFTRNKNLLGDLEELMNE
jgi:hypothetical protein